MANAYVSSEIVAQLPAKVGLLAEVAAAVRDSGVNVKAISAYEREGVGKFLLVTSDDAKAREALRAMGAETREKQVLIVQMPDEPGSLTEAAGRIAAAGINIEYVFGSAAQEATGPETMLVFGTSDDEAAAKLF